MSIVENRKAFHDYFIEERFEAGLALEGWEVKSVRAGRANLKEAYVIVKNGGPNGSGGVFIGMIPAAIAGRRVFAFNTVSQNSGQFGMVSGVVCDQTIGVPLAMTSNIVVNNAGPAQVSGTACSWTYSDITPGSVSGAGNLSVDPLFVDPVHNNFHLQLASPARDAADPAATLAVDIDGDTRPQGAGRDMGADEIK